MPVVVEKPPVVSRSEAAPQPEPAGESPPPTSSGRCVPAYWDWLKIPVTFWLMFHCAAMVIYPAAVVVPQRGLLGRITDRLFQRYMQALYMVAGHRFFAPEPGAATLIQYRLEHPDGTTTEQIFPHRDISPRLLYHRYFMMSERVGDIASLQRWYRMYARHLSHHYDADRVTMWRVVHRLADPDDIIAGKKLNDREFYDYTQMGSWTRNELEHEPLLPAEDEAADSATRPGANAAPTGQAPQDAAASAAQPTRPPDAAVPSPTAAPSSTAAPSHPAAPQETQP